jgi:hypothetical protein
MSETMHMHARKRLTADVAPPSHAYTLSQPVHHPWSRAQAWLTIASASFGTNQRAWETCDPALQRNAPECISHRVSRSSYPRNLHIGVVSGDTALLLL